VPIRTHGASSAPSARRQLPATANDQLRLHDAARRRVAQARDPIEEDLRSDGPELARVAGDHRDRYCEQVGHGEVVEPDQRGVVRRPERTQQALGHEAHEAHEAKMLLGDYVMVANMPETDRLWNTICQWWTEIEVLIVTGVTNARTEAANTSIKNIKRTGRGFRNPANYRARILLRSAAKRAA
jgi:Transposase